MDKIQIFTIAEGIGKNHRQCTESSMDSEFLGVPFLRYKKQSLLFTNGYVYKNGKWIHKECEV